MTHLTRLGTLLLAYLASRDLAANALFMAGGLLIAGGIGMVVLPAGVIALGVLLVLLAVAVSR